MDRYAYDLLPPDAEWPEIRLPSDIPERSAFNCCEALLDAHIDAGHGNATAFITDGRAWSYAELDARVRRIANMLTTDYGVAPGNRVLLRGYNSATLASLWLAVQMTGAIAVTTMPLLRSGELKQIIDAARPALAVSEEAIAGDLADALAGSAVSTPLVVYNGADAQFEQRMESHSDRFETVRTNADDLSLIAFTSGTTGQPKATAHFHRDILAVCRTVGEQLLGVGRDDVFIGTSPLAFTFGLGGLVLFPLYAGAASVLNTRYQPDELLEAIGRHRATICFTVPTLYQRMTPLARREQLASLRLSVSSGEALALPVRQAWEEASGLKMTELLGSTEMLHAFVGATGDAVRPGYIGMALSGYEVAILGDDGAELPRGQIGRLAVKGPTGCRYLSDPRQRNYVQNGWNITGDACAMSEDGYVSYHSRLDELIVSAGNKISHLEVEDALLSHPDVAECAVVGLPDQERGMLVTAFVVPKTFPADAEAFQKDLQAHVRAQIAPYKYPRRILLMDKLPRNESGKLQRFRLRQEVSEAG